MAVEAGHIQITEYRKETIPYLNWMMEDLFCRYEVSIPYYLLDFSFPDYPLNAEWPAPYEPEILELYRPGIPPWPEFLWPQLPEPEWPEMNWPALPEVLWPKPPEMPGLELPPWPEMELPEWELEWPEWDWPRWEFPERERIWLPLRRPRIPKMKEWPVPWQPFKPEWQRTWPYETEWRGTTWYIPAKPEWRRTWPYRTEWRGIIWSDEADNLLRLNTLLEIIADEAGIAVEQLSDWSDMEKLNNIITELYEEAEVVSADYTFNSQAKDGYLEKWFESRDSDWGAGDASWNLAWDGMKAVTADVYTTGTRASAAIYGIYVRYEHDGQYKHIWDAITNRGYLSFDTSSLAGKTITAVTLKLYVEIIASLDDYETNRTVNIYTKNWDTLDAGDWNGGTLVATLEETDLTANEYYTITLTDITTINQSGETQFEIAFKIDVDETVITDPQDLFVELAESVNRGGGGFGWATGDASSNKPVLTATATG